MISISKTSGTFVKMIHHMPAVYLVQAKQLNIQQIIAMKYSL